MIRQETAAAIWHCHREIETAEKLLLDMAQAAERSGERDPHAPRLSDAFGRKRDLQLGIPMGEDRHRLFNVSPVLAESVIRAHIARKQAELVEMNEVARGELGTGVP